LLGFTSDAHCWSHFDLIALFVLHFDHHWYLLHIYIIGDVCWETLPAVSMQPRPWVDCGRTVWLRAGWNRSRCGSATDENIVSQCFTN
jgi:hypothetical protein